MLAKKFLFFAFSAAISILVFAGVYEFYNSYKYDRWHEIFRNDAIWNGNLTIPSKNKTLMWEYRPNGEYKRLQLKTNKFGFRQRGDTLLKKSEGVLRIGFIGDSVTLGYGIAPEETFVSKFEAYGKDVFQLSNLEALNFGIDGYNTLQIRELLTEKVIQFSPDKVIYTMCPNDFDYEDALTGKVRFFKKPDSFFLEFLDKLYKHLFWTGKDFHEFHFEKNKISTFRKIMEMRDILEAENIEFYVAVVPVFKGYRIKFAGWKKYSLTSFHEYPLTAMHKEIIKTLNTNGVRTIDLLNNFKEQAKPPDFFGLDLWHPTAEGHRLIAHSMANFVFNSKSRQNKLN